MRAGQVAFMYLRNVHKISNFALFGHNFTHSGRRTFKTSIKKENFWKWRHNNAVLHQVTIATVPNFFFDQTLARNRCNLFWTNFDTGSKYNRIPTLNLLITNVPRRVVREFPMSKKRQQNQNERKSSNSAFIYKLWPFKLQFRAQDLVKIKEKLLLD